MTVESITNIVYLVHTVFIKCSICNTGICVCVCVCVWQVRKETHHSLIFWSCTQKGNKNDPPHLSKKATTQHGSYREIPNKLEMQ